MFFPLLPPGFRTDTANLFFFPDFRHGFFLLRLFLIIIVNIDIIEPKIDNIPYSDGISNLVNIGIVKKPNALLNISAIR